MSSEVQAKCTNPATRAASDSREALLQPVLDRLDVVVGLGLDRLDLRSVLLGERFDQALERLVGVLREGFDLGERRVAGEREQPADLRSRCGAGKARLR